SETGDPRVPTPPPTHAAAPSSHATWNFISPSLFNHLQPTPGHYPGTRFLYSNQKDAKCKNPRFSSLTASLPFRSRSSPPSSAAQPCKRPPMPPPSTAIPSPIGVKPRSPSARPSARLNTTRLSSSVKKPRIMSPTRSPPNAHTPANQIRQNQHS